MQKLTLIQRFSILCIIALIFFGVVFGWIITKALENAMLERSKQGTASIVSEEVWKEFASADFITTKIRLDYKNFSAKMKHLSFGPNIERVKVWNKDGMVVWSDDKRLVGQRFLDNNELNDALKGKIVSKMSKLEKTEQVFEQGYERLLELYVPIQFEDQKDIQIVFEIYKNLDPLYIDISHQKLTIWTSTILGFIFLYLLFFGIVWHASKRIAAQNEKITQSEVRYRNLVQSAKDGIISIDQNGRVILINSAAEQIFGYTTDEIMGQLLTALMPEKYREKHQSKLISFFEKGETTIMGRTIEIEGLRKNGQVFPLELSLSVSQEENLIVTGIIRDISERKAIQEQLLNAEKQASVGIIAGSIGHEINNINTSLIGYSELLMGDPDDNELAKECAEIFSSQAQRLNLHGNNLLSLSKPRKLEMKPIALNSFIDKVTEMLFVSGVLKTYSIIKKYSEGLPTILGDEMLLEQVIRNLEINAAHAMGNQGILKLKTGFSEDKSHIEFSIVDTGHGISNDKRHQIFLPFYTTKEKGKGTGLGMYIVKQIVDRHNGYINLESKIGIGTNVTIGLPIVKSQSEKNYS